MTTTCFQECKNCGFLGYFAAQCSDKHIWSRLVVLNLQDQVTTEKDSFNWFLIYAPNACQEAALPGFRDVNYNMKNLSGA
jgi:hypothetical protein